MEASLKLESQKVRNGQKLVIIRPDEITDEEVAAFERVCPLTGIEDKKTYIAQGRAGIEAMLNDRHIPVEPADPADDAQG